MSRGAILLIITIILLLCAAGAGAWYFFSADSAEQPYPEFTPPPLSDNPPMGADAIDSIAREIEEEQ